MIFLECCKGQGLAVNQFWRQKSQRENQGFMPDPQGGWNGEMRAWEGNMRFGLGTY